MKLVGSPPPSLSYANNKWDVALRWEGFEYENASSVMVALKLTCTLNRNK